MKSFNRLFKKTSTGAIQYWDITVQERVNSPNNSTKIALPKRGNGETIPFIVIRTDYGQLDTENPQYTEDLISEGRNIGKANETSVCEQAETEAKSRWEKKKKSGYVESLEAAEAGEVDDLVEGGIVPMLAHGFIKHGHKIKYPCYIQPKLDGIRCIAILKEGKCTLWSRTRKLITSCPHIVGEIEKNFSEDITLDGELYNEDFKDNFEHIVHLVRQEEPDPQCTDIEYHIYDIVNDKPFRNRVKKIAELFEGKNYKYLEEVFAGFPIREDMVMSCFEEYVRYGYEGAMLRNADGLYVNKRSYDLLKVKEFDDAEFEITGIDEGRGKLQGHVGAFVCRTKDGKEFLAKMSGETSNLKKYFEDHSLWSGKLLTVQYQGLTGANGVPRFPVGLRIREEE